VDNLKNKGIIYENFKSVDPKFYIDEWRCTKMSFLTSVLGGRKTFTSGLHNFTHENYIQVRKVLGNDPEISGWKANIAISFREDVL